MMPTEWRDFFALTKPRVMTLVIFTAICGVLAAPGSIHPVIGFTAILAIAALTWPAAAMPALHSWAHGLARGPLASALMRRLEFEAVVCTRTLEVELICARCSPQLVLERLFGEG